MIRTVVAGLDGSPESLAAADWAAREATSRGLPLRLVHAWAWQPYNYDPSGSLADADATEHWAERIPREASATLRRRYPRLPITADQIGAPAVPALLSAAEDAELLVLGSRGLGTVAGFAIGSVALAVVAAATRPVVLLRAGELATDEWQPDEGSEGSRNSGYRDVVLGLDLERPSDAVTAFAFGTASRRTAALRVVHSWYPPAIYGYAPVAVPADLGVELAANVRDALTQTLLPWQEKFPDVEVTADVRMGGAAAVLIEAASDASLLVVGRRTRGSSIGSHIGSVTHAAMHHAKAPIAVVPHD
ncbi:Nucleotide-binding universal stress protein, UspA family [Streptomyces sp. DvalAA-14]|uniref:universal stress protein n=1 Tax=unclassified Streptomyces TaxID=2593676 RepID=UPI00081AFD64|nr:MULTISPECIES: universal stress protein [unclassified Streptomyces]MYS19281.1 universal stress protein [Streptomyces sp. SID4948]SCD40996.1 Nucleotide-binding universal stress protein, UspA family [Streptomyces sp. DvalAA-14]